MLSPVVLGQACCVGEKRWPFLGVVGWPIRMAKQTVTQESTPSSSGGSGRLKVDLEGLERFGSTLESIRRTMDGTRKLFDAYTADLGSAKVAGSLHEFDSNWHDGRKEIDGKLQGLSKSADKAVEQFRRTDTQLGADVEKSTHQQGGQK